MSELRELIDFLEGLEDEINEDFPEAEIEIDFQKDADIAIILKTHQSADYTLEKVDRIRNDYIFNFDHHRFFLHPEFPKSDTKPTGDTQSG